jgi:hypothetical protein
MKEDPRLPKIANVLRDMLTLTCSYCRSAVDPSPDACAAILCLNCSSYYCNYCFQLFNSDDSAKDKADCHIHASTHQPNHRNHSENQSADPFLSSETIKIGHKQYRTRRMIQSLRLVMSSADYAGDSLHFAALAMILCFDDLISLEINPLEIWFAVINEMNPFLLINSNRNDYQNGQEFKETTEDEQERERGIERETGTETTEPITMIGREPPHPPHRSPTANINIHSGKILANAILSQNEIAIKQILSAYQQNLEVNHRETVVINDPEHPRIAYPLLTLAILKDYDWLAIDLIEKGAILLETDNTFGRTCLMIICEKGATSVLEYLWQAEVCSSFDWSQSLTEEANHYNALQVLARFGHNQLIKRFLTLFPEIDINCPESFDGYSPLSTALLSDHIPAALQLIALGADIYSSSIKDKTTPIYIVIEKGFLRVLQEIIARHAPNHQHILSTSLKPKGEEGYKALHVAVQFKSNHLLSYLIDDLGVDINDIENIDAISPFAMAILYGNTVAARNLLCYSHLNVLHSYFDQDRLPM